MELTTIQQAYLNFNQTTTTMNNFQQQLNESGLLPIFEIEVTNSKGQTDYVVCDIYMKDNQLVAQRDAVSTNEEQSQYIAKTVVDIDEYFSLDEHLQKLFDEVNNDIVAGDLYNLA